GQVISRQLVVAGCDAPEVLQPVERTLDAPAQLVRRLLKVNGCFLLLLLGMTGLVPRSSSSSRNSVSVVGFVAEHAFRRLGSADQALGYRAIVRFTASQQDGDQAPFSICECVNLRIAPSARAANSLLLLPPFPPAAERCALMCVASIICVSVDRP